MTIFHSNDGATLLLKNLNLFEQDASFVIFIDSLLGILKNNLSLEEIFLLEDNFLKVNLGYSKFSLSLFSSHDYKKKEITIDKNLTLRDIKLLELTRELSKIQDFSDRTDKYITIILNKNSSRFMIFGNYYLAFIDSNTIYYDHNEEIKFSLNKTQLNFVNKILNITKDVRVYFQENEILIQSRTETTDLNAKVIKYSLEDEWNDCRNLTKNMIEFLTIEYLEIKDLISKGRIILSKQNSDFKISIDNDINFEFYSPDKGECICTYKKHDNFNNKVEIFIAFDIFSQAISKIKNGIVKFFINEDKNLIQIQNIDLNFLISVVEA